MGFVLNVLDSFSILLCTLILLSTVGRSAGYTANSTGEVSNDIHPRRLRGSLRSVSDRGNAEPVRVMAGFGSSAWLRSSNVTLQHALD
jgi:hypothetical protein